MEVEVDITKNKQFVKVLSAFLAFLWIVYSVFPAAVLAAGTEEVRSGASASEEDDLPVYDGRIILYNYLQLSLIGSDDPVTDADAVTETVGSGTPVETENGTPVTYSLSASYTLAHDILLPRRTVWQLPAGFTGSISGDTPAQTPLYDADTDTIYLYNPYQPAVMAMGNAEHQPLLSGDASASTFGTGQVVSSDGHSITYSGSHRYVLSQYFDSDTTNSSPSVRTALTPAPYDGRDFQGQVLKTIDSTTYILIGNEAQLRAIGTNTPVYTAIFRSDNNRMLYGGDADLLQSQNGTADYAFQSFRTITGVLEYGVYQEDDALGHHMGDIKRIDGSYDTHKTYSATENYIIFRDIDLENRSWTPLMFYGTMTGAKAVGGETLWDRSGINTQIRPAISHVSVVQNSAVDVGDYFGVGFFATLTTSMQNTFQTVRVTNLELNTVSVRNQTTEIEVDATVISAVTSGLGQVLGTVLKRLVQILSLNTVVLDTDYTLQDMLDAKTHDKTNLATGAFVGRIVGDVEIDRCAVTGTVEVYNENDRTGGFAGYTDGEIQYGYLTQALGGLVSLLSNVLNLLPWLGVGDLITILLENALPLKYLVPTGYINPVIRDCEVDGLQNEIGKATTRYNGGFIGQQVGTIVEKSELRNSHAVVRAQMYGGGFSGIARDERIRSTLTDVGLDIPNLLENMQPKSLLKECVIQDSAVAVIGTDNIGGFAGGLCSSYAVNCSILGQDDHLLQVDGSGDDVGGFCGCASLGWFYNENNDDEDKSSLLGIVGKLLVSLLSDGGNKTPLLSLTGAEPSALLGVQIHCGTVTVSGDDYVGGILGDGEGVYLTESSADALSKCAFWFYENEKVHLQTVEKANALHSLSSVSGGGNFVGGIAGSVGTASAVGLLGKALGLGIDPETGDYISEIAVAIGNQTNHSISVDDIVDKSNFIGFTVRQVTVYGIESGYTVTASGSFAGGGFGAAIGGTIHTVTLHTLQTVTAVNKPAGFAGCSGPGDLVGSDGLSINLLGLNNLLKVNNLLSIGECVEVDITDCTVNGIEEGFTVEATGSGETGIQYAASGFLAKSNSTKITNSHVVHLKSVVASNQSGYAGGFVGISETGGLTEITQVDDTTHTIKGIELGNLVSLISYLIPSYVGCTVTYVSEGYVQADLAGGFAADFRSGTVDNSSRAQPYAVYQLSEVKGKTYGGGFGGRLVSGALASAAGGISVLGNTNVSLNITDLVGIIQAYVPVVESAGVYSENGFTVTADEVRAGDLQSGSAGGFAGYTSGAQISSSDVNYLKHTTVVPPSDLEAVSAPTYFTDSSRYAVKGGRYAGGYAGYLDIGSAASVGDGLKVLGTGIQVANVLDALSVVVTTVEHSDVFGGPGGFAVLADGSSHTVGKAGGFAGSLSGGHIQDSHANNFSYIIGEEAAGGYVGHMEPGDVANVLGDGSILDNFIHISGALASLVEDFVPTIRNSTTNCIPCGGAVRANAPSDASVLRGCAGGYCGHNEGGHIWGLSDDTWKDENNGIIFEEDENHILQQVDTEDPRLGSYTGTQSECRADRIRSVYGYEYAGGFTGFMESADTASTGSIGLLEGVLPNGGVQIGSILSALKFIYPTQRNTVVCGPLRNLDVDTWNRWVRYVAVYGGYGMELAQNGPISEELSAQEQQEALDELIDRYAYGYQVAAGRSAFSQTSHTGGDAGGYVGMMSTGAIENGQASDAKLVKALRNAGGFAGKMKTGGLTSFGTVSLGDITLNVGQLLGGGALQVLVPKAENSSVTGYHSGLTVIASGNDAVHGCGAAGGYVGSGYGAQIWGDRSSLANVQPKGCRVQNLRGVYGGLYAGGFAGLLTSASVADANTNISDGILQGLLDAVVSQNGNVASLLKATISTVKNAEVSADNDAWGFSVQGVGNSYPRYAGGFAGYAEASVIGDENGSTDISVQQIRRVDGGLYAGGFFGLADVGGVAEVSNSGENQTTLLGLIQAGQVDVLDVFRTYIYHAETEGVDSGLVVQAHSADSEGLLSETRYSGCAGGFGGGIMNGTVKNASAENVRSVTGLNYTGGFIGHLGKNGAADVDSAGLASLLGVTAGVLDVFGSHAETCSVEGIADGMTVLSENGQEPIVGGFAGYADVSRIKNSTVTGLKLVQSDEIAGGFAGKTDMHYLIEVEANSPLIDAVLKIVNFLVKALYVPNLENAGLLELSIPGMQNVLTLKLFSEGDAVFINLLGLKIGVSLVRAVEEGQTDTAVVTIGDSTVRLPCTDQGIDTQGNDREIVLNLLKGNATKIERSSVTGIGTGYDVNAGGASYYADGTDANGYAGGFTGYNNEGRLFENEMIYCDVVRGSPGKVGHFNGYSTLQTVYDHSADELERQNRYHVYRPAVASAQYALTEDGTLIGSASVDTGTPLRLHRFDLVNLASPIGQYADWEDAILSGTQSVTGGTPIGVYESSAKAVLMKDTLPMPSPEDLIPEPADIQDPCDRTVDYTIQKVWDDGGDYDGIRPTTIRVRLWQHSYQEDGTPLLDSEDEPVKTLYEEVVMTLALHGRERADVWKTVIHNLPTASVTTDEHDQETIVYYSYTVEELSIEGYSSVVEYDTAYSAVITNVHRSEIPLTGGPGDLVFVISGIGMIGAGTIFFRKRKEVLRKRFPAIQ